MAENRRRPRWRRLGAADGQTLVEFRPLSGRTHQIRVHAARGLGAAIVGDPVYSLPDDAELGEMTLPDSGMMLHAWRLVVPREPREADRRHRSSPRAVRAMAGFPSVKAEDVQIPEDALSERFLAATGPGGQNVNKVATACQLRVDVFKLGLTPYCL